MSSLSSSTYSWGGDAGLLGRGGDEGGLDVVVFGAGLNHFLRPTLLSTALATTSSSVEGGEDSAEESESDILVVRIWLRESW